MKESIIEEDSLLSNISNVSVRIDHNFKDGSGLFSNLISANQNQMEVHIDALIDNQSFNSGFFVEKFYSQSKAAYFSQEPENTWVLTINKPGFSQEEQELEAKQEVKQFWDDFQPKQPIENKENKEDKEDQKDQKDQEDLKMQTESIRRYKLLLEKRLKNETKNIPKNFGKAIISFIQKYTDKVKQVTEKNGVDYDDFPNEIKLKKRIINTIADLRSMWVQYKYAKCIRVLSNLFLRRYALHYIFNSRICNYSSHIKYRHRLCEAIQQPFSFKHIKYY